MSDLIKKIKIKKQDDTYTDYIPIGAEAKNVDCSDGESVEYKLNKKPYYYNSVADMKADTKLKVGDIAITLGYYEPNDSGGAEYKIVNNEDIVNYQEKINNNLYATLIKKDYINIKQFGAKGDQSFDDTNAIQNAINQNVGNIVFPKGIYLIKSQLIIRNHNYIGYNAEIWIDNENNGTEYIIYNENYFNSNNYNTFTFDGINFKCHKGANGSNYLLSFKNVKNVIFNNCKFYTDDNFTKTTHLLDFRCNNQNITIQNCNFYIDEEDSNKRATCILIRNFQGNENSYSNNITINNCLFRKNCQDEMVWVNADCGNISNVNVINSEINDVGSASNTIWFGATDSGVIKNCNLNNCNIYKANIRTRLISLGYKEDETDTPTIENINVNNCYIKVNNTINDIYTYIFISNPNVASNISINDVKIEYNKENLLGYCFYGISNVNNCNVNITNNENGIVFANVKNVNGGNYKTNGIITKTNIKINNANIDCKRLASFDYNSSGTYVINIQNSYIKTSGHTIGTSYNTAILNILFKNCIIENLSGLTEFYSVSNSTESVISLVDSDVNSPNLIISEKPTLKLINLTVNKEILTGIPSHANTRGACAIGTLIPTEAVNTNHAFVKKISMGDLHSNWVEI